MKRVDFTTQPGLTVLPDRLLHTLGEIRKVGACRASKGRREGFRDEVSDCVLLRMSYPAAFPRGALR